MRWYVNQHGETVGPFTEERIAMLATWGKLSPDAYICDEQFSSWVSITRTAFGPLLTSTPAAPESAEPPAPLPAPAGQKLRAWLAGFMLIATVLVLAISAT